MTLLNTDAPGVARRLVGRRGALGALFLGIVAFCALAGEARAQNPVTAVYPAAVATDDELLCWSNNTQTRLSSRIDADDMTLAVWDSTGFCAPTVVKIGEELIKISAVSAGSLTVASGGRGFDGTTAAEHYSSSLVDVHVPSYAFHRMAAEIKATQSALGANLSNVSAAGLDDTDDLDEGATNLYFTNARARGAVSGGANVTYTEGTGVFAVNAFPYGSLSGVPATFAPSAHASAHQPGGGDVLNLAGLSVAWGDLTSVPASFAPSAHAASHGAGQSDAITIAESQISDLAHFDGAYGSLSGVPSTFAPTAHASAHQFGGGDVLSLAGLSVAWGDLTSVPATFTPSGHLLTGASHTATGLTAGHVLQATGATAFGFAALDYGDLANAPAIPSALADLSDVTGKSGNTDEVATVSGTKTTGKQLAFDASGNVIASGTDIGGSGGTGETNTASNVGSAGVGVFKQKDGVDLELYKLNSTTNRLGIALDGTDKIDFTVNEGNLSIAYGQLTGTPSIPAALDDLTDVTAPTPAEHDMLTRGPTGWISGNILTRIAAAGISNFQVPHVIGGSLSNSDNLRFSGVYLYGASLAGSPRITFSAAGSTSAPTYSYNADTGTGLFRSGAGQQSIVSAGDTIATFGGSHTVLFDGVTDTRVVYRLGSTQAANPWELRPDGSETPLALVTPAGIADFVSFRQAGAALNYTHLAGSLPAHAASHQSGGGDELSLAGLAVAWGDLTSVPATFTPSGHLLTGASHTASGLTAGHVLQATGATAFGFAALDYSDLANPPAIPSALADLSDVTGKSGNTDEVATVSGTKTTGKQLAFDASGNVIASATDIGGEVNDLETDGAAGIASGEVFVGNGSWTGTYRALAEADISDLAHTVDTTKTIEDEGTPLTQRAVLNFVGDGVTCADSGGENLCTIPGGGGGGSGTEILTADFPIPAGLAANVYSRYIPADGTLTLVRCLAPAGVTFKVQLVQRGGSDVDTFSTPQTCNAGETEFTTGFADSAFTQGEDLLLEISDVTGSPADGDQLHVYVQATTPGGTVADDAINTDKLDDGSETPVEDALVTVSTGKELKYTEQGSGNGLDADTVDGLEASAFATPAGGQTFTNKTYDAEATGNDLTIPSFISVPVAVCTDDTTGAAVVSLPTTNAPAAGCVSTTTHGNLNGTLAFDQSADESFQFSFRLPPGWTGALGLDVWWQTTATSGDVVWATQTACIAAGEDEDAAFNAADAFAADTADAQASDWNLASDAALTATGCAPDELLVVKFFRDADNGADTLAADALVKEIRFTVRNTF